MYERRSRLSARQQSRLLEHFVAGTTARAAAALVGVQPNTAAMFFLRLRQLIASKVPSYQLEGEVEADESYFGGCNFFRCDLGGCNGGARWTPTSRS